MQLACLVSYYVRKDLGQGLLWWKGQWAPADTHRGPCKGNAPPLTLD